MSNWWSGNFLYNWCEQLRDYYDITVLYASGDPYQVNRLSNIVKMVKYDKNKTYTCDIFIRNSVWGTVPDNIISKDNRYIEIRHADYEWLLNRGVLYDQYHPSKKLMKLLVAQNTCPKKVKKYYMIIQLQSQTF